MQCSSSIGHPTHHVPTMPPPEGGARRSRWRENAIDEMPRGLSLPSNATLYREGRRDLRCSPVCRIWAYRHKPGAFEEMLASDGEPLDRQTGEPRVVCCYVGNLAGTSQDVSKISQDFNSTEPPPRLRSQQNPPPSPTRITCDLRRGCPSLGEH